MIKIHIDEDNQTLIVTGHADYAENGKDIVCAGVSALVQTLEIYAIEHGGKSVHRPGYARVDIMQGSAEVFRCIAEGLRALGASYDAWVGFT